MNAAIILAGGSGERLFPYSSEAFPKQFLPLVGQRSMLQETYTRLLRHFAADNIFIVTLGVFVDTVLQQLPSATAHQIIVEPARRNTAGAIALTLARLKEDYDVLLFCPADHYIPVCEEWDTALKQVMNASIVDRTITLFGAVPSYPETGYGYVEYQISDRPACRVVAFHEKPSRDVALRMVQSGRYLWNCGIYAIPCDTGIIAFKEHLPSHYHLIQNYTSMDAEGNFLDLPTVSIDYGLIEKLDDMLQVVPAYFPWNDIGSWTALEQILSGDENDNCAVGSVKALQTKNTIVFSPNHEVYLYDVTGLLVVCHNNQVLVANKHAARDIKHWLPELKNRFNLHN